MAQASLEMPQDQMVVCQQNISLTFLEKRTFCDLEIICNDGIKLYHSRYALSSSSEFFRNKLLNQPNDKIDVPFGWRTTNLLFKCDCLATKGFDVVKSECFDKINTEDVYDFLLTCKKLDFPHIKKMADDYFSADNKIIGLFSTKLILFVNELEMTKMIKSIKENLTKTTVMLSSLDFSQISLEVLQMFEDDWRLLIDAFSLWVLKHDPTDEQLNISWLSGINYLKVPRPFVETFIISIRNLSKATKFKEHTVFHLTYVLIPKTSNISPPLPPPNISSAVVAFPGSIPIVPEIKKRKLGRPRTSSVVGSS